MGSPLLLVTEYPAPRPVAETLAARAHPGAIVVLHEGTAARAPVAVVADVLLAALEQRGLRAVTLSDLRGRPA